ncbi:hypothetical protein FACS1894211_04840 [Clostridia bacterium]|nr:hypothetical protein FACS1894211_04840 [Clostridia bacterium]
MENMENAEITGKEISFLTLFKAILKKWLLIGLCTVFGVLVMAFYVLAFEPPTKEIYKKEIYIFTTYVDVSGKTVNNLLDGIFSYLTGEEYKYAIYNGVKDDLNTLSKFAELQTEAQKRALFFKEFVLERGTPSRLDVYTLDYGAEIAQKIMDKTAGLARIWSQQAVDKFIEAITENQISTEPPVVAISSGEELLSISPDQYQGTGAVTSGGRVSKVVIGGLVGLIVGAGIAVVLYFFNGKVNSANMLEHMGVSFLCRVKDGAAEGAWAETAARLKFSEAKKGGHETIVLLSFGDAGLSEKAAESVRAELGNLGGGGSAPTLTFAEVGPDYAYLSAAAGTDGAVLCVNGKKDRVKNVKAVKESLEAAGVRIKGAVVVEPGQDFVI